MQAIRYQSYKITNNRSTKMEDALVIEAPLQININQEAYTVVMRTPADDKELIRGLLYAEDIYKGKDTLQLSIIKDASYSTIIEVTLPEDKIGKGYLNKRTLLSVSSCGICGKKELKDIEVTGKSLSNDLLVSQSDIQKMFLQMQEAQNTFHLSGGSHACAVFSKNKQLLAIKEDIGRHNAVDKCVGTMLNNKNINNAHIMLVSGRVSYEIVSKAFFAKIPIIVAVSACSSLAVDFAKEFGICLIGFNRDNKMTIYANPQYISYE